MVFHRRRRNNQRELEFPPQTLADDFHVEHPQKSQSKSPAKRGRRFRLVEERCVGEFELAQRISEIVKIIPLFRIKTRKNHPPRLFISCQSPCSYSVAN